MLLDFVFRCFQSTDLRHWWFRTWNKVHGIIWLLELLTPEDHWPSTPWFIFFVSINVLIWQSIHCLMCEMRKLIIIQSWRNYDKVWVNIASNDQTLHKESRHTLPDQAAKCEHRNWNIPEEGSLRKCEMWTCWLIGLGKVMLLIDLALRIMGYADFSPRAFRIYKIRLRNWKI